MQYFETVISLRFVFPAKKEQTHILTESDRNLNPVIILLRKSKTRWTNDVREGRALARKADHCCGPLLILVISQRPGLGWARQQPKRKEN